MTGAAAWQVQLQLILPALVLPLALSAGLLWLTRRRQWVHGVGVVAIWLPSYLWIAGLPAWPPREALEWVGLLGLASAAAALAARRPTPVSVASQAAILLAGLLAVAWPVLRHQPTAGLVLEIGAAWVVGSGVVQQVARRLPATPALTVAISSAGLALVAAVGGSLRVGQLAGALAAVLGAFALFELDRRFTEAAFPFQPTAVALLLFVGLLAVARIYVEVPLAPAALLLAAPLAGVAIRGRYASAASLVAVAAALAWLLLAADDPGYY